MCKAFVSCKALLVFSFSCVDFIENVSDYTADARGKPSLACSTVDKHIHPRECSNTPTYFHTVDENGFLCGCNWVSGLATGFLIFFFPSFGSH